MAAAAILPASAPASGTAPRTGVGTFQTPMFTDGERYAVAQLVATRSLSSLTGEPRGSSTRGATTRSRSRPQAGYSLVATGGGAVLFTCSACRQPPDHAASTLSLVYDIPRRRFVVPPAVNRATDEEAANGYILEPGAIGSHWVSATEYGCPASGTDGFSPRQFTHTGRSLLYRATPRT